MSRACALMALALAVMLALAGCSRRSADLADIKVLLDIQPSPPAVGSVTVNVLLRDASDRPINGATVELEGGMSHAGMAPVLASTTEVVRGRYQARLELTMAGDWYVTVRAGLPDGRSLERSIPIGNVRGP